MEHNPPTVGTNATSVRFVPNVFAKKFKFTVELTNKMSALGAFVVRERYSRGDSPQGFQLSFGYLGLNHISDDMKFQLDADYCISL